MLLGGRGRECEKVNIPRRAGTPYGLVAATGFVCSKTASQTEGWSSAKYKKAVKQLSDKEKRN